MVAAVADMAVAALSDVLETNDKQHLSISILLTDNQQLKDKLDATKTELSSVRMEKHAALDAGAATELLLAESQARADTQMMLCSAPITLDHLWCKWSPVDCAGGSKASSYWAVSDAGACRRCFSSGSCCRSQAGRAGHDRAGLYGKNGSAEVSAA